MLRTTWFYHRWKLKQWYFYKFNINFMITVVKCCFCYIIFLFLYIYKSMCTVINMNCFKVRVHVVCKQVAWAILVSVSVFIVQKGLQPIHMVIVHIQIHYYQCEVVKKHITRSILQHNSYIYVSRYCFPFKRSIIYKYGYITNTKNRVWWH